MLYLYYNIWIVRIRIFIDIGIYREENGFMDGIKYVVFIEKSIWLLGNN